MTYQFSTLVFWFLILISIACLVAVFYFLRIRRHATCRLAKDERVCKAVSSNLWFGVDEEGFYSGMTLAALGVEQWDLVDLETHLEETFQIEGIRLSLGDTLATISHKVYPTK